jgi:tetratricopeptide (TPR) repeat protein
VAKRRIPRKELKQPDEFITLTSKIIRWGREQRKTALGAGAGIVALALLVGAFFLYRGYSENKARALYEEALALYPTARTGVTGGADFGATISKLEEVRKNFGSTKVAIDALVDLGNAYFRKRDYDKAIDCFKDLLQRMDRRNYLYGLVLEGLGTAYEAKGDWAAALKAYQQLAEEGTPIYQTEAQLCLGRVYEAKGDRREAISHYDAYLKGNPDTLFGERLRTKLSRWRLAETPEAKS